MVSQGRTGEGEPKNSPFAGVGSVQAAPVATPVNLSSLFLLRGGVSSPAPVLSDAERFCSQAAEDFGKCFGGEL